jgi:transcription antitermination factor NusG
MNAENLSYSGHLWHVAYVETRCEIDVAEDIHDELGFPVFVPAERIWTVRRGRRVQACSPLFSGYVFPRVDPYREDWQQILGIDGVIDVLGRVPTAWVYAMQKAQDMGVFDRTVANASKFKVGERVRVSDGLFAGFNAIIEEFIAKLRSATASKRAKVLVQFMGRMSAIEMDVTALEKL